MEQIYAGLNHELYRSLSQLLQGIKTAWEVGRPSEWSGAHLGVGLDTADPIYSFIIAISVLYEELVSLTFGPWKHKSSHSQ